MLRFHVDSINDAGLVVGRNDHIEIPLGSVFTSVSRTRYHGTGGTFAFEPPETVANVHLTVLQVHWYQGLIHAVPPGHTAGLALAGSGLDRLAYLLGEHASDEVLSLVGPASADA